MLIGNTFPLSLIRRRVAIEPVSQASLLNAMQRGDWTSFWGHENTVVVASAIACADLRPTINRPALTLSSRGLPSLDDREHDECWVISPDYKVTGYRPAPGEIVGPEKIASWQILKITWRENA